MHRVFTNFKRATDKHEPQDYEKKTVRVAKYNQLLRIEDQLNGTAQYCGKKCSTT
ncbi:hypothetical protein PB01_14545 [Psychrobacillus glaciei]|uniref:Enolase n=1 Tax=Psychrobacillus glaciei TaxID=2283160 RepID=A0A5J6SQJ5_9BACI|nr:hypothetical protein PB01_14545 [Psychrobacillus glaciei]